MTTKITVKKLKRTQLLVFCFCWYARHRNTRTTYYTILNIIIIYVTNLLFCNKRSHSKHDTQLLNPQYSQHSLSDAYFLKVCTKNGHYFFLQNCELMQKHKTVLNTGEVMSMFQTLKLLNILCSNVALQLHSRRWKN
jgi:hypothetical protein